MTQDNTLTTRLKEIADAVKGTLASLSDLLDVDTALAPTSNQFLQFDGIGKIWKAQTIAPGSGATDLKGLTDVFSSLAPTIDEVLRFDGGLWQTSKNALSNLDNVAAIPSLSGKIFLTGTFSPDAWTAEKAVLDVLDDVIITSPVTADLLRFNGTNWVNASLTTAGLTFDILSPTTTKGDIIAHNGTVNVRLPIGADTFVLTADAAEATGIKWAAPAATGANTALSNLVAVAINTALISDTNSTDDLGTAALRWKDLFLSGDISDYVAVNDGNPQIRLGAVDAEELHIQAVFDTGAQTLSHVQFTTDVASATVDKGEYRFNVDGANILEIDDAGVDLQPGLSYSINGTIVLNAATLGSGVTFSSLVQLGTITTGVWSATDIAVAAGGSGRSSATAFAVLCGGTTTTAPHQSIAGLGASGEILTSNGAGALPTFQAAAGGGNVSNTGTPLDNQVAIWTGTTVIEGDPFFTFDGTDLFLYNAVNGSDPEIRIGSSDTNEFRIVAEYEGAGNQLLTRVAFITETTSVVGDPGRFSFIVDSISITDLDSSGINMVTGSNIRIASVDTLNATTLGSTVVNSSLTSLGTITTGVWNATDIAVADGGSGRGTATAFAVLCGGTTSTAAHQSVAGLGASGDILTSNGAGALPTFQASAGGGNVSNSGTPVDNQIAVWLTATTIEGTPDFTFDGADLLFYNAVNDGNPEIRLGASDAEEFHIQTIFDAGAQTLNRVVFLTDVASATANRGLFRFNVDGTDIMDVDDGGANLAVNKTYEINSTTVLDSTTLGAAVTLSSLVTVGILNSGSINVGFGAIDNGTSNITTGGILKLDVDGTAENAAGSLTMGAGNDSGIFFDGTNLKLITNGAGGLGIVLDAEDDTVEILGSGVLQATFDTAGLNLVTADRYAIAGTNVLNATTLGTGVLASSLTSVGTLTALTMGGNIVMADNSVTGIDTLTFTDLLGSIAGIQNQNLVDKTAIEVINAAWIFDGGSASLEIPNAAGGRTVNAAGEVTVDTTSKTLNFHDGTAEKALIGEYSKSISVEDPVLNDDITMFFTNDAITVTEMRAVLIGASTPSVTWTVRHGTSRAAAGAEVVTSGTVTTSVTTGSDVTTFNDATIVLDSFVWLEVTAQSGVVDEFSLTIFYTVDV